MTTSNAWQTTLVANAEQHNGWASTFYEYLLIEVLGGTAPVFVATDGTIATVNGANLDVIPAGGSLLVSNRQPKQDAITTASGSTAQKYTVPASGSLTYVSVISSGTPQIVVSPQ